MRILRLAFSSFALLGALLAQDPRGGISGTIVDESGALMPGVRIRATNVETGVPASAETNQSGGYRIPYLPAGLYRLNAEVTGFKTFIRDRVEVRVGETLELPIRMELGSVTETVEVKAETPVLETAAASLGQTIDQRRIQELPQRGGNPLELALLTPGVINAGNMRLRKAMAPEATSEIAADGAGRYNNEFQIDGITNMSADRGRGYGRVAFSPPQSAVREFKMQTSAYDASVGHTMGALVNVSTASGANEYHGEIHYFLRHRHLDAPNFFVNKNSTPQPVYQDHRYGGSIGGHLSIPKLYSGKNRSFWFYTFEQNPFGVPVQWVRTVPTADQRQGDFSALLRVNPSYQIYDPQSTRPAAGGRFERVPFAGNIIPRSRLDPVGQAIANLYPLPNQPGTSDGRNNFFLANKALQTYYVHLLRLDHAFTENHRAFLRLHYDFWKEKKNNDFGNWLNGIHQNRPNRGIALDDVIVLSPQPGGKSPVWIDQYEMVAVSRFARYDLASLGFSPNLLRLLDPRASASPRVTPGAYSQISWWEDPGDGVNSSLTHSFNGTVTRVAGNQAFVSARSCVSCAAQYRRPIGVAPDLSFGTTYTRGPLDNAAASPIGQDLASLLLGIPDGSLELAANSALQNKFLGIYIHDDWRVTSKLTLNLGLRYELETPVTERYDRLVAGFDSTTANPIEAAARANYARNPIPELSPDQFRVLGGLTWATQGNVGRSPYAGESNNIMPRFGFAYQLTPKSVLRGGYGLFFDTLGILRTLPLQTGFAQSTPIQASLDNGQTYIATLANPFPNGLIAPRGSAAGLETNLGQGIEHYYRDMKQGYSQRWSFGLQQQLPAQFLIDMSYVGNRGTRLAVERNLNPTPAQYLSRSPVRDQQQINFLTQQFPNPFRGLNPIYGANISRANLLRPFPEFGDINAFEPIGYSWYHSFQLRSERRFSQGFTLQVAYTWSKLMEATEFLNPQDPTPYESISTFDRPHRLAGSGIWEIPVGRGRKFGAGMPSFFNHLAGGWQLGGVLVRQSGAPLAFGNVLFAGDIKDINLPSGERTVDRWFNTTGFNRVAAQQLANNYRQFPLRFADIRGDGQFSLDATLSKYFAIGEKVRAQFRADAYNATNTTNLNNPNTAPTNTAFGQVTGTAGDARNFQLSLKLMF